MKNRGLSHEVSVEVLEFLLNEVAVQWKPESATDRVIKLGAPYLERRLGTVSIIDET